jgi:hypothetical protein
VPTKGEHSYEEECKCTQILKISLETFVNKIINNNKHSDKHNKLPLTHTTNR